MSRQIVLNCLHFLYCRINITSRSSYDKANQIKLIFDNLLGQKPCKLYIVKQRCWKLTPMQTNKRTHTRRRIGTVAPPGHEQELPPRSSTSSLPPPSSLPPSPPSPTAQLEVEAGPGCLEHFPNFCPSFARLSLGGISDWHLFSDVCPLVTEFLSFSDNRDGKFEGLVEFKTFCRLPTSYTLSHCIDISFLDANRRMCKMDPDGCPTRYWGGRF